MRLLAATLLLVAAVILLLLGGAYGMSARYRPVGPAAEIEGRPVHAPAPARQVALAILVVSLGVANLVGGILVLRRRARLAVLAISLGSTGAMGLVVLLEGPMTVALISCGLLASGCAAALLARRRPRVQES